MRCPLLPALLLRGISLVLFVAACGAPPPAGGPETATATTDSGVRPPAAAPPNARPSTPPSVPSSVEALLDSGVPRAVAGEPRWRYQQRASADWDGDGARETAVLIADVELDAQGRPLWEDGHRWQLYVEEPDSTRTYLYARFLPNGTLTADLARPSSGATPTIVLVEQTPYTLRVYDVAYRGQEQAAVVARFARDFAPGDRFTGSPRP